MDFKHEVASAMIGIKKNKTRNISETGQERTKFTVDESQIFPKNAVHQGVMINRRSHTRFQLVLKSMTLDDLERPLHAPLQKTCLSEPTANT